MGAAKKSGERAAPRSIADLEYRRVVTWDTLAMEGKRLGHEGKEANDMAAQRHT
jgi:hypothetical protein